jgi:hypothetical protein
LACATTNEGFDPRESWTEADEADETATINEGFGPRFSPRDASARLQGSHVAGKTLRDDDDEEEDGAGAAAEVEIEVATGEGSPPAQICWRPVASPSSAVASAVGSASEVLFRPDETDEMGGAAAACALVLRTRCRLAAAL